MADPVESRCRNREVLPRGLEILLGLAAAVVTIAGIRSGASIIGPTVLALVLTIAVHPLRTHAVRCGVPPWAGTVAGVLGVYALLVMLTVALVFAVAEFATLLPSYEEQFDALVDDGLVALEGYGVSSQQIDAITGSFDAGQAVSIAGTLLSGLLGLTSDLLFIITLLLFMGMDASHLSDKLRRVRPEREAVVSALGSFTHGTRRYLVVSTVFGLIVAVLDTAFLAFTPVPVPILWGLLAFITNYIPNIGFVIGLVPPAILALLEGGPGLMILVIAVYSGLNFVIQSVIQPKFVGDAVGLSGTVTFLSLIFWGWALGALGALLAVPLSLLVKALLVDVDPDARWLSGMLAGGPASPGPRTGGDTQPTRRARGRSSASSR
ncbi:MAG: AI-2E family transporter [Nocardioidaceae bacterium]|nr:AI-2E family transporter [Nocardioidaceae bacterium]